MTAQTTPGRMSQGDRASGPALSVTSGMQQPLCSRFASSLGVAGRGQPTRRMVATCGHSGLFRGPRQLFDLAAVDHVQSAPCGLAELGVQGAAEVIDLHVGQGVEADDDAIVGGQAPVCMGGHIPPPPPQVGASLDFQVAVGFGKVQLLRPRDGLFGPKLRVWSLLRLCDRSVLPGSRFVVPAQVVPTNGLLSRLGVTSLTSNGDSWVSGVM